MHHIPDLVVVCIPPYMTNIFPPQYRTHRREDRPDMCYPGVRQMYSVVTFKTFDVRPTFRDRSGCCTGTKRLEQPTEMNSKRKLIQRPAHCFNIVHFTLPYGIA